MTEHKIDECPQADRLERIEDDVENHREWRKTTTIQLTNIEISIATIDERLKASGTAIEAVNLRSRIENLEEHSRRGTAFRASLILVAVGLLATVVGTVHSFGRLFNQVEVNTKIIEKIAK